MRLINLIMIEAGAVQKVHFVILSALSSGEEPALSLSKGQSKDLVWIRLMLQKNRKINHVLTRSLHYGRDDKFGGEDDKWYFLDSLGFLG